MDGTERDRLIVDVRRGLGRFRLCACHEPALGHVFHEFLRCKCGVSYAEHQESPTVCELALDQVDVKVLRNAFREIELDRRAKRRSSGV